MASRGQHMFFPVPRVHVVGWGPHRHASGTVSPADVSMSFHGGRDSVPNIGARVDDLTPGQARALAAALLKAADAAEASPATADEGEART